MKVKNILTDKIFSDYYEWENFIFSHFPNVQIKLDPYIEDGYVAKVSNRQIGYFCISEAYGKVIGI